MPTPTWAFVQGSSASSSGTVTSFGITPDSGGTAGHLAVLSVLAQGSTSAPTVTVSDTLGNTLTLASGASVTNSTYASYMFYGKLTSSGSDTFTLTISTASQVYVTYLEYSCTKSFQLDGASSGLGMDLGATTFSITSPTVLNQPDLIVAQALSSASSLTGAGGSWTERYNSGGFANGSEIQDYLNATTTESPSWTPSSGPTSWLASAISFGITPALPPTRQPSQRFDSLPDLTDTYYQQHYRQPFPIGFSPRPVPTRAEDQHVEPLEHINRVWWQQYRRWPIPTQPPTPTPPPTKQPNQELYFDLPDLWQQWAVYRQAPYAQWYVPTKPTTRQSSQRVDPLLDYQDVWFQQHTHWPVPVGLLPTPPPTRQSSQRVDPLLDYQDVWFQQRRWPWWLLIPPSTIFTSQAGAFGSLVTISGVAQVGGFRVQNNIEGYNVFVGTNALPDLTQAPTTFSLSLPISIPVTPPVSGTVTINVLVTKQDTYGLQSQNQYYTVFVINSSGNLVLPSIPTPQSLKCVLQPASMVQVLAAYTTWNTDEYPATLWKIWAGTTLANPLTDTPIATQPVSQKVLTVNTGPFVPGDYYVMVGLYRATDGSLSQTIYTTIVVPPLPIEITPVLSGFSD